MKTIQDLKKNYPAKKYQEIKRKSGGIFHAIDPFRTLYCFTHLGDCVFFETLVVDEKEP